MMMKMKMNVFGCLMVAMMAGLAALAGEVTAMGLTATQRYPWNGLVDIAVTLSGASNDVMEADCIFVATNSATHVALNVVHVTTVDDITGSGTAWTQKFVWDAKADVGAVKINDVALTVDVQLGVQLWANGPYWAKCNVGATKPEESGYYFWWGDTVGYKRNASNNGWVSVKDGSSFSFFSDNCPTDGMNTSQLQAAGYIDMSGNLVAAHDAATAHLGAPWRMPTEAEFMALNSYCTITWTTRNGVNGRLVTGRGAYASRSIFLPAGYYWSSTQWPEESSLASTLVVDSTPLPSRPVTPAPAICLFVPFEDLPSSAVLYWMSFRQKKGIGI